MNVNDPEIPKEVQTTPPTRTLSTRVKIVITGLTGLAAIAALVFILTRPDGSSGSGSTLATQPTQPSTRGSDASSPSPSPSPVPSPPVSKSTVSAATSEGDRARVDFTFGPLVRATQAPSYVQACLSDPSRALVERMDVVATTESSLAASIAVTWNLDLNQTGVALTAISLAANYTAGPTCLTRDSLGSQGSGVTWQSLAPGHAATFSGWWIFEGAISPAFPGGDLDGLGKIFIEPSVTIAGNSSQVSYSGARAIKCSSGFFEVNGFYLAGNPPINLGTDSPCISAP